MREQLATERAAGMRPRKVFLPESARVEKRHRQRIAYGELRRGACRGCQVQRAGFLGHAAVKGHAGLPRERGLRTARNSNQGHALPAEHRKNGREFFAFAAVGNCQHHVDGLHHAEVAMAGLGRMDKHSRRAGGGQRSGDLAADVATLAHAHDDDSAPTGQHQCHRLGELGTDPAGQSQHRRRFNFKGLAGKGLRLFRIKVRCGKAHGCILSSRCVRPDGPMTFSRAG